MDAKCRELLRSILKRALDEGREGRVLEVQRRLKSAREIPENHQRILNEITWFGKVLPKSPFSMNMTMH